MRFLSVSILFLLLSPAFTFTILGWQRSKGNQVEDDNHIDKNAGKLQVPVIKNATNAFIPQQIKCKLAICDVLSRPESTNFYRKFAKQSHHSKSAARAQRASRVCPQSNVQPI